MNNAEKKIVTTVVWSASALFGLFMADWVYGKGMAGYMKLFHKDLWDKAVEEISQED